ncbi:IS66 family transposase [Ruminiclostridium herbifermentans]|uniref:IS66 family transposase n=1 Tax=Ruminiclostridium herbifermentans TaxID=2488810 RepID=A0A4U7J6S9_9FIRM|nr:IS66 family transposase [Ruminiclostridium herbifermentans]
MVALENKNTNLENQNANLENKNTNLENKNAELTTKLNWFEEHFRLNQHRLYGSSSEKTARSEQMTLFNEAEALSDVKPQPPEPTIEDISYTRKKKQKGHKEEMLKELPCETIEYKLSEDERVCNTCGEALHEMSKEITKELKIIPPQVSVVEHVRYVYSCRNCEKTGIKTNVVTASMPKRALPGSIASADTIAYTMVQKYMYGIPLNRQEQSWKQLDVDISRQTMANWLISASNRWLTIVYDRMRQKLLEYDIICADETTVQVLNEPGRAAETTSYMWLYRTGRDGPPMALLEYQTTRARKHAKRFLGDFKGYLCTDAYQSYDGLDGVINIFCNAHARRKFDEALKSLPKEAADKNCVAKEGLKFFEELYKIEKVLHNVSPEERYEKRLEKSKPILDKFYEWLKYQRPRVTPKSTIGQAINYCINHMDNLAGYLKDGRLYIDNNNSERSMKSFAVLRKNFLFCNTQNGATASAVIFSIIETAKENNLKPFEYLKYLLEALPNIDTNSLDEIDRLLPWSEHIPEGCKLNKK